MIDIAALKARADAAEARATATALSAEEQEIESTLAREANAIEKAAAAAKTRRGFDLAERETAARDKAPRGVLVKGIDLFDFFQFGEAPDPALMPGGGVIVVRSPEPARFMASQTEFEHKKRAIASIFADLLCEHTVFPDVAKDAAEGMKLRAFCDAYPGAATAGGDVVAKLGGSKAQADKRGRS